MQQLSFDQAYISRPDVVPNHWNPAWHAVDQDRNTIEGSPVFATASQATDWLTTHGHATPDEASIPHAWERASHAYST